MYIHNGWRKPVLYKDPIDPDSTDEFYFVLGGAWDNGAAVPGYPSWLRTGETVASATPTVTNGAQSGITEYATRTDEGTGYELRTVYGIMAAPTVMSGAMEVRLRITTAIAAPDNPRQNIDFTIRVPVREL